MGKKNVLRVWRITIVVMVIILGITLVRATRHVEATVEVVDEKVALAQICNAEINRVNEKSVFSKDKKESSGFVKTEGTALVLDGKEYVIKGVCASNEVARNPLVYNTNMMTEQDYQEIAELGMNTVRFLFNYGLFETNAVPYQYKDTAWEWFDMNIAWAEKYGIKLILDCHIPQGWDGNTKKYTALMESKELQNRYISMWKAIATRYSECTTILGYGLINEPKVTKTNSQAWSVLSQKVIEEIREVDKNHILIVQSANIDGTASYIRPNLPKEDNWMIEIHKYPLSDLSTLTTDSPLANSNIGYTNDYIVWVRNGSQDNGRKSFIAVGNENPGWSDSEWSEIQGVVDVTKDSNNANLLVILSGIQEGQRIYVCDLKVTEYENGVMGKEVYNSNDNAQFQYSRYIQGKGTTVVNYPNNIVILDGKLDTVMFADKSYGRYFTVDNAKQYYISFKLRVEGGNVETLVVEPGLKYYKSEDVYLLNRDLLALMMDFSDLQAEYNVPVFIGEVGTSRYSYDNISGSEQLVDDLLAWLVDNNCNFTWFSWHEPTFGIYTNSGLEEKSNVNISLLNKFRHYIE